MNHEKLINLKSFSQERLFHPLVSIKNNLPDNYLSENNLLTKDVVIDRIDKILNCSSSKASSTDLNKETGEITTTILYDNSCGQYVLCPICSRTRAEIIRSKYGDALNELVENHDKKHIYFMTFTIENQDGFSDMYDKFNDAIRAFMRMGQKRNGKTDYGEAGKILSAIMGIEVKQGKGSNEWHVHGHMLAFTDRQFNFVVYDQEKKAVLNGLYPKRIPKEKLNKIALHRIEFQGKTVNATKLSYEWFKATNGTSMNIEVSLLRKDIPFKKQLNEIIKYPTKLNHVPKEKLLELITEKDRKRFLRVYGSLRGISKPKTIEEEENEIVSYSLNTRKYVYAECKFIEDDHDLNKLAEELNGKRKELKDFLSQCSKARVFRNSLLKSVKQEVFIKGLGTIEFKESIIKEVNSIYQACKIFCGMIYEKLVRFNHIKNYDNVPPITQDTRIVLNGFMSLRFE